MNRVIFMTNDGSSSIEVPSINVTYHSRHGAIRESLHVFIDAGFLFWNERKLQQEECHIFEMGFGTGLNALLTLMEAEKLQRKIFYHAVELYPLEKDMIDQLNYCDQLQRPDLKNVFLELHSAEWEKEKLIAPFFTLRKSKTSLANYSSSTSFHIIYYDAFAPSAQPELWTKEIFEQLYKMLLPGGLLVTYCSKSEVRHAMKAAGFTVEKIPGPPGKREMARGHHSNV
jgi:tRNA U34 5-methylaminomethyl-2-thiouridine-forming methyltransferase MnmC